MKPQINADERRFLFTTRFDDRPVQFYRRRQNVVSQVEEGLFLQRRFILRAPNKMIVARRIRVFDSGKEGEAGHPRMVDAA